jgi:hypothetical protein
LSDTDRSRNCKPHKICRAYATPRTARHTPSALAHPRVCRRRWSLFEKGGRRGHHGAGKDLRAAPLDREFAARAAENTLQEGLILLISRQHGPLIPLSTTDDELDEGPTLCWPARLARPPERCWHRQHRSASYQFSNDSKKILASSSGPASLGAMLSCRCCLSAPLTRSSISPSS